MSRLDDPCEQSATLKTAILLDYVLEHAKNDSRPHLQVSIYGQKFLGLLDSGANRTIIGGPGWTSLRTTCDLNSSDVNRCTVANGQSCTVLGTLSLPFELCRRIRILEALVVPELPQPLILGMDFWRAMEIVPDMYSGEWHFRQDSQNHDLPNLALASVDTLSTTQRVRLDEVIDAAFKKMGTKLGCTSMVEHVIKTNHVPIRQRHYPISPAVQAQVNVELEKMLEEGIIEKSNSPWASPILLIKKKDNTYRFVVDYRQLNKVTERDAYPLPFVNATLDKLRDARYISTLDIKSAYWQIPLAEESRPLTAFVIPNRGLFQFRRMPMGLHNAPATWQRFIDQVVGVDLERYVFVYLDDAIICTPTFEKHIEVLQEVLKRLTAAGLTLNREKCHFCKSELRYLGYMVGASGLMVDPEKVAAIVKIPSPRSVSEVRRLIGVASWYRRFVPNFSTLVAPLCQLLKKNQKFTWTTDCENSFMTLKNQLISAPILTCPDFTRPFFVQTDASDFGIGAVLSQVHDDGEKVISYLSRSLTTNERKFSTVEKECLSVLYAIERFRPYIEGSKFTVITDNYSLKWLNSIKDPVGRIARWAVRLQQYDFEIQHRRGKEHVVPDTLSRSVPVISSIVTNADPITSKDRWYYQMCQQVEAKPEKYPMWRSEGNQLFKRVEVSYPALREESEEWLIVVPREKRLEIIKINHDPPTCGHLGVAKTYARVNSRYYWPKMRQDIARYVRHCHVCLQTKPEQRPPAGLLLSQTASTTRPWQLLSVDIMGPLPRTSSGHCYILSVVDVFSKFLLLFPMRKATASKVCELLENQVILLFGSPQGMIMDNGVQFRSKKVTEMLQKYKISQKHISFYHPQANPVERYHRVIKSVLTAYVADNHNKWDKYLQQAAFAIRTARHDVTQLTPCFIMFGREMNLMGSETHPLATTLDTIKNYQVDERQQAFEKVFTDVSNRLKKAQINAEQRYNLRRRDERFQLQQKVWRRNFALSDATRGVTAKFLPKYLGPYQISRILSPWCYELVDDQGKSMGSWHAKDLKSHPPDD